MLVGSQSKVEEAMHLDGVQADVSRGTECALGCV